MLKKYFGEVESVMLPNKYHYEKPEEIVETLKRVGPSNEKRIIRYQDKLTEYFSKIIEQKGEIVVDIQSQFWRCKK